MVIINYMLVEMYKPDSICNFTIKYSNHYTLKKFGVETIFTQKLLVNSDTKKTV